MTAMGLAFKDIKYGDAEVVLCGGLESLSNTPFLWPRQRGARPGRVDVNDPLLLRAEFLDKAIACYTGEEAVKMGIDRLQQDEWAASSHNRFFTAENSGVFTFERFSVDGLSGPIVCDESPRENASVEALGRLDTVYSSPTVTPGNAPGLNDGAAFVMLASGQFIESHGLTELAQVLDYVQVADAPTSGARIPADAIRALLSRSDLTLEQISLIEINEAFAATPLVSTLSLADGDLRKAAKLHQRTNVHGGAVAIGHPLGASGARISMSLVNGLRRDGGGLGIAAICGGYGQGDGLLIRVD
jgi:acetyl-CoA C-acetyltransferase